MRCGFKTFQVNLQAADHSDLTGPEIRGVESFFLPAFFSFKHVLSRLRVRPAGVGAGAQQRNARQPERHAEGAALSPHRAGGSDPAGPTVWL